ncbi:putative transmembrane protein [Gregarina niphandrodes]|uniref:Transmembrane protein n=1 Tax=Gregarina niphandrodes TaxID=110365 RepID=A0A023B7U1_GRENI|nr:putative transmembrane protein [Gregarina niphandrodes]EZG67806.1 putative transmembrane protein [Gregarina niphandrodes]|eukprot:XP_011130155.1 putative transmembrane protein [Gregarina niphandrodes]
MVGYHVCVAFMAFLTSQLALPFARAYILRSDYFLSAWRAQLVIEPSEESPMATGPGLLTHSGSALRQTSSSLKGNGGSFRSYSTFTSPKRGLSMRSRSQYATIKTSISRISTNVSSVTIKACPFDCEGRNYWWRKKLWSFWRIIRLRPPICFCPQASYLPPNTIKTLCCAYCCIYVGQVDDLLRPHGLGVWVQGWGEEFGESLNGAWEFGRPIAPFASRQNTCGSGFTALRLGWMRFDFVSSDSRQQVYGGNTGNRTSDEALIPDNYEFGLLDVECSIFGKFFRKFPKFIYWKCPLNKTETLSRPALGLNNRLSSFSWLELERLRSRSKKKRTGIVSKATTVHNTPIPIEYPPCLDDEVSCSNDNVFSVNESSVPERGSSGSSSGLSVLENELQGTKDIYGSDETEQTRSMCSKGLEWVVERMLPYHIPPSPLEDTDINSNRSVTVKLDCEDKLVPQGWRRNSEPEADGRGLTMEPRDCRKRVRLVDFEDEAAWPQDYRTTVMDSPRPALGTEIGIRGWTRGSGPDFEGDTLEAMVFIHGYKTPLHEAPLLLGQLIALGGFPNKIKPFMFLWPAGTEVWHYYQARRASHHYLCQRALIMFLKSLANNRVKNVHILAHSMGSRLFLNSLKYANKEKLFIENYAKNESIDDSSTSSPRLNLLNLVFLHPEHYLDDFVLGGGYEATQRIASQTTVYTHASDEALASAELLSRGRRCMGKHPFGYVRVQRPQVPRSPMETRSTTSVTDGPTQLATDVPPAELAADAEYEWLDLDVIDCTYLDANVHGLRHCFFNINGSVVGDIRELLTQRNRAAARHNTLEKRDGNVYTFRTPPVELNSIFGM